MISPAAEVLAAGLGLADMHRDANRELGRHRPDGDGVCQGCGDTYPCAEEWAAIKLITVIESRWRREGRKLAALQGAEWAQNQAAAWVAGSERQET